MRTTTKFLTLLLLAAPSSVLADTSNLATPELIRVQAHEGQMDTDGILSPGERRNPNIDYDKAQQHGEHRGDSRYDNPENDRAADIDHEKKEHHHHHHDHEHNHDRDYDHDRDYGHQ